MKQNRFGAFADEDVQAADLKAAQQKQQQEKKEQKKVVVKVQKKDDGEDAHEFAKVENKNQQTRGGRGGRGDRRGGRGGDRPQGDRPHGENRGGRGGRGRGDRPKTAQPVAAAEGALEGAPAEKKERRENRGGRGSGPRFQGKAREDAHPMDRKDGTGRGRRGDRKAGHGKGNWGKEGAEKAPAEEEKEAPKKREPTPEPVVEEEVGFTLDDYLNAKQAKSKNLYATKNAREHEKQEIKNVKDLGYEHSEMATTKIYKKADTQATHAGEGANLLGFQAQVDAGDEFEAQGKRGNNRGQGQRPQTTNQGGRKRGGKVYVAEDFPAL